MLAMFFALKPAKRPLRRLSNPQEGSKMLPRRPKTAPRRPKTLPSRLQTLILDDFWFDFSWIFHRFFGFLFVYLWQICNRLVDDVSSDLLLCCYFPRYPKTIQAASRRFQDVPRSAQANLTTFLLACSARLRSRSFAAFWVISISGYFYGYPLNSDASDI